ncbi:MAG: hypothetical protein AB1483_10685 [Candidatus Zixiibacteriota bacterium]
MRTAHIILLAVVFCWAWLMTGCVETETKRTTKKVDVSNVQVYQLDAAKPRIRVGVTGTVEQQRMLTGMLQVEIDDGQKRYSFGGEVCTPNAGDSAGTIWAPWVNTPDTGTVTFSFRLVDEVGSSMISDKVSAEIAPDLYSQVQLGIFKDDPCAGTTNIILCREYTLPRTIQDEEGERLFLIWCGQSLSGDGNQSE